MTEEERDGKGKPQVFPTNKYKNTTIYKIFSEKSPENFYIGHTSLKLSHRFAIHRYECKVNKSKKLFKYIQENGGFDEFKIIALEKCECENVREARMKERDYILMLKPTLNQNIPLRSLVEWRKESSKYNDYMRTYMREYNQKKKPKFSINYTEALIDWD